MRFVWDERKSRHNLAKHTVSFETATLVFDDRFALSRPDRVVDGEQRWQTMDLVAGFVVLLVAHTVSDDEGDELIRIISARKATSRERRIYEESKQASGQGAGDSEEDEGWRN